MQMLQSRRMQRHVHTMLLDTHGANATDAVRLISTRITFQCHQVMQPGGYVDVRERLATIANCSLKSILKKKKRISNCVVVQFEY